MSEKIGFRTEVSKVLHLVVHSLYSNKEIVIRELISNSSDAIDKVRFLALTDNSIQERNGRIKLVINKDAKTLTIKDNGIGMNREDLINSLGTIANSGTKEFLEKLSDQQQSASDLIGQFGVGFYSAFMIADKVQVVTKKSGEKTAYIWESDAQEAFTIDETTKDEDGTDIILYIADQHSEFLEEYNIKNIIQKYSNFIKYPIVMDTKKEEHNDKGEVTSSTIEEEVINAQKALWLTEKSEISQSEYDEFYQQNYKDYTPPLDTIHFKAEGSSEFAAMLFIPSKAPFDIFYKDYKIGPALYVRKVLIMENCADLLPLHLRFIKGVVDSSDLPLNVSREILQSNKQIALIKKNLTKKVYSALKSLKKEDFNKYVTFHKELGKVFKEGIYYEPDKRDETGELLLFESTKTNFGEYTDLDSYIGRMAEGQADIYYITGGNRKQLENSPYLESLKEKNIEVLFAVDETDEMLMGMFSSYKGKNMKSAIKEDVKLDNAGDLEAKADEFKELTDKLKDKMSDKLESVRISARLRNSAVVLAGKSSMLDPQMQRIMESLGQAFQNKRTMEINPEHDLIKKLNAKVKDGSLSDDVLAKYAHFLYDTAVLSEGGKIEDIGAYTKLVSEFTAQTL